VRDPTLNADGKKLIKGQESVRFKREVSIRSRYEIAPEGNTANLLRKPLLVSPIADMFYHSIRENPVEGTGSERQAATIRGHDFEPNAQRSLQDSWSQIYHHDCCKLGIELEKFSVHSRATTDIKEA